MKISIYKPTDVVGLRGSPIEVDDDHSHVTVEHNGHRFDLSLDNEGRLVLRERNGHQLLVLPQACNTVELRARDPFETEAEHATRRAKP